MKNGECMRILNISSHIDGYGIIVNNCIDYNIAGAASFYDKKFLKLYCVLWGLYSNYDIIPNDDNITNSVLNDLGLQLNFSENITEKNIIEQIQFHIDNNTPIILGVNHASLFYSIMYKELNNAGINHNIIIHGYDAEKEIIYIKENTINNEVLDALSKSKVFSSYKITYDMLIHFYTKTKQMIKEFNYNNYCLYYIQKIKNIDLISLTNKIILTFLEVLINNRDYLYNEINQLLYGEKYNSYYRSEQFRRTYFYSLIPLFDFLDETLFLKNEFEFHELKNEFFENRERIINVLAKNSLSNKKNDIESIKDFRNSIESISNRLYYYIKNKFNYIHDFIIEENNYLEDKQTILSSDSEDQFFVLNNIRKESNVNDNFSFWKSSNEMIVHWILIDFKEYRLINKIIIEHHSSNAYITKQFSIYGLSENGWIMLVEIKQNTEKRSYFYYKIPIKLRKIKINIEKPNYGVDYTARIKLIEIC